MPISVDVMENAFLRDIFLQGEQKGAEMALLRGKLEGRQEGRQEGIEEGLRAGLTSSLTVLLQERFGQMPEWALEKMTKADPETLNRWILNTLKADSLPMVFQ
ncbi:MAG: hypothetical protein HQM00_00950 [Magnetococcales bacterium]|nr:hypothetical protein [Magnetococcales bacterium]